MTREEAERYSKLCVQLEALQEKNRKKQKTVVVVKGSDPEFPYTEKPIKVSGHNPKDPERRREHKLIARRAAERKRLEEKLLQIEDPEIQTILWLYYHDRLTQDEIAERMNYDQKTISNRIAGYFAGESLKDS